MKWVYAVPVLALAIVLYHGFNFFVPAVFLCIIGFEILTERFKL